MKTISETIREAMIATGLSDLEISRQVGVSQPQLWHFRKGTSNPKASTIDALAAWLGFTLTRSEPGKPKRKPKTSDRQS